jgi:hypothetical protein
MISTKSKGLFVEVGTFSLLSATTSSLTAPMTIDRLYEAPMQDAWSRFRGHVESLLSGKGQRFVPSHCSIYPDSRFFRRFTIESAAKAKEDSFFGNVLSEQMRIDLEFAPRHGFQRGRRLPVQYRQADGQSEGSAHRGDGHGGPGDAAEAPDRKQASTPPASSWEQSPRSGGLKSPICASSPSIGRPCSSRSRRPTPTSSSLRSNRSMSAGPFPTASTQCSP